jgi:hypothetical protein
MKAACLKIEFPFTFSFFQQSNAFVAAFRLTYAFGNLSNGA